MSLRIKQTYYVTILIGAGLFLHGVVQLDRIHARSNAVFQLHWNNILIDLAGVLDSWSILAILNFKIVDFQAMKYFNIYPILDHTVTYSGLNLTESQKFDNTDD